MRRAFFILSLLTLCSLPVAADDRLEHGDWSSQFLDGMGEATTHENGMAMFGMLCAKGSCRYYFANDMDCEAGANYPLMITTDVGALSFDAICEPMASANGDVMLYWFNESPALNQALAKTPSVGFAFPLSGGQFKTSKFSMDGYNQSLERMVNGMRAKKEAEDHPADPGRT